MTHCVYRHIRPDTNEVFYVGIGNMNRPYDKRRTKIWENVVAINKGKYRIDIMLSDLTKKEAEEKEKEFIALYGRRKDNTGTLVNFLAGGYSYCDYKMTLQQKEKAIKNLRNHSNKGRKWTEEQRKKFLLARTGVKRGPNKKSFSEETIKRMKEAHKGNQATKDHVRITNGIITSLIHKNTSIPEGWKRGELKRNEYPKEFGEKVSIRMKGKNLIPTELRRKNALGNSGSKGNFWINNGNTSIYWKIGKDIPHGWIKGRINLSSKFLKKE